MKGFTEALVAFAPFIGSYPIWVRSVFAFWLVLTTLLLLSFIFTPRSYSYVKGNEPIVRFVIRRVDGFMFGYPTRIRVTATVNGHEYVYPSGTLARWVGVGPDMSGQSFDIPYSASGYKVFFTIRAQVDRVTNMQGDLVPSPSELYYTPGGGFFNGMPTDDSDLTASQREQMLISQWTENIKTVPWSGTYVVHTYNYITQERMPDTQATITYALLEP